MQRKSDPLAWVVPKDGAKNARNLPPCMPELQINLSGNEIQ